MIDMENFDIFLTITFMAFIAYAVSMILVISKYKIKKPDDEDQ